MKVLTPTVKGPVFKLKNLSDVQSILLGDIGNVWLTQKIKELLYNIREYMYKEHFLKMM